MEDLCSCGCGERSIKGASWAKGHRPRPELKPCACGCGELVKGTWGHGHHARVKNPSKDDAVRAKRSASSKRRIADGDRSFAGWNRGLSSETDARVAAYGLKNSERILADPERTASRSESCLLQWEQGRIRSNKGVECYQWKGGISTLQQRSRAALHHRWARPIMVRDGFQCQRCHSAKGGDLVVHHDVERFASIMHRIVAGRDVSLMSFEEQGAVIEDIVHDHLERDVHGVTLCRPCHAAVHAVDPDVD